MRPSSCELITVDTFYDGYTSKDQIESSFAHYFERNNKAALRDAVAPTFGMYGLLRSNNQRLLKLSEIAVIPLDGEGPTECSAVVAILDETKTNKRGKIQFASFICNRNVLYAQSSFCRCIYFVGKAS